MTTIHLIISGGIAAYKSLELIRRLKEREVRVVPILTRAGAQFVTELSVSALAGEKVYKDLWSLTDEAEMGHIRLARDPDLIVVAPATANLLAKMAHGLADDLASTILLATDKPVLVAPAMNPMMWDHAATQANVATLKQRGIHFVGPMPGDMACGETGTGRMAEVADILRGVEAMLYRGNETWEVGNSNYAPSSQLLPLTSLSAIVTAGATQEPLDPVRHVCITNGSSGRQGVAIAAALATAGADVTLIHGALQVPVPPHIKTVSAPTAKEMLAAVKAALPADIAICAAAVADWTVDSPEISKIKKKSTEMTVTFTQTPDILAFVSEKAPHRPRLVIGFALETNDLIQNATEKWQRKGCDWMIANQMTVEHAPIGATNNIVTLITETGAVDYPRGAKTEIAQRLVTDIIEYFQK